VCVYREEQRGIRRLANDCAMMERVYERGLSEKKRKRERERVNEEKLDNHKLLIRLISLDVPFFPLWFFLVLSAFESEQENRNEI
jgi:hypothetical protein